MGQVIPCLQTTIIARQMSCMTLDNVELQITNNLEQSCMLDPCASFKRVQANLMMLERANHKRVLWHWIIRGPPSLTQ